VLTIGEAGAAPDDNMVVDRLRVAGHTIVSRASVDNFVPVVRRQLAAWISDANIDVAIVVGGGDDNVASAALAPLITQALPGFADVFRMLMFQTLGSAAVLANAEAARCTAKVVFLLPAMADGVALALDKLIIPQLDPKTEPYNVARLLPRRTGAASVPPPTSSSQPGGGGGGGGGGGSPSKTMPPPFVHKKVVTPPVGIPANPPGAKPDPDAKPADDSKKLEAKSDDAKVIVDIETIGAVVEPDDAVGSRAATPTNPAPPATALPTSPIAAITALVSPTGVPAAGPAKKLADSNQAFSIRVADSQPRMAMFDKPKRQGLHPIVKGLAALALLAATAAISIILWTHFELRTKTVSAGNPPPLPPQQPAVAPPVAPQEPAMQVTIDPVDASVAPPEIDVDPAAQQPAQVPPATHPQPPVNVHPHTPLVPPSSPRGAVVVPGAGSAVAEEPKQSQPTGPLPAEGCDEVSCVLDHYQRACCEPFKPKEPSKTPGVSDDLDRASVYKAIESMKPVVITCGERFKTKGTVRVHLVVAPDGHVSSASVESTPDSGLGTCVAEALRRVQFKRTNNGGELTYPYVF
jgi:molybdenum cofactor biosynthesis protein B